ncbi:MAG: hypothetical protein ACXU99_11650 [Thermodesulfobacteriota bacterium]
MTSYVQNITIEMVVNGRGHRSQEEHPATTIGLPYRNPVVQFVDSLDREQRIEAIAHEFAHLVLVYRYGLGVIGLRIPRPGDSEEIFKFCMNMNREWNYMLGQIINTAHHLILIDYLKEEYGIDSSLHLRLLHRHFCRLAREDEQEKEPLFAKGVIAFEYERLIGNVDKIMTTSPQTNSFWKAYHSAQKHFESYGSRSIPTSSSYEETILSFLEALGYQKEEFIFFSEGRWDLSSIM